MRDSGKKIAKLFSCPMSCNWGSQKIYARNKQCNHDVEAALFVSLAPRIGGVSAA